MNFENTFNPVPQVGMQNWYGSGDFVSTNVYKVTSLEEAIMKSNARPSETVYFHQSKPEFYNVRVDIAGNKTWQTFSYGAPGVVNEVSQITREEFNELVAKVTALEGKTTAKTANVKSKATEVTENG